VNGKNCVGDRFPLAVAEAAIRQFGSRPKLGFLSSEAREIQAGLDRCLGAHKALGQFLPRGIRWRAATVNEQSSKKADCEYQDRSDRKGCNVLGIH
jgi:hypothetical protein